MSKSKPLPVKITGKVTKQKGKKLTIEDAVDGSGWTADVADVTVVEEEVKAPAKGKTKTKKPEAKVEEAEEEEEDNTRPRKMLSLDSIKLSKTCL